MIKIFPAPHLEIRVHVSDEMIQDYRACRSGKNIICCDCSWDEVEFGDKCMCDRKEMRQLLKEEDHGKTD